MEDVPAFDTAKVAAHLRKHGGFDEPQAAAIVDATVRATAGLVTRNHFDAAMEKQAHLIEAAMEREALKASKAFTTIERDLARTINAQTWRYIGAVGAILALFRWVIPAAGG